MARDFDTSLKFLVEHFPLDWLHLVGIDPGGEVEVVNANVSSVQLDADKVLHLRRPRPHIVHIEFESNYKIESPERALLYNLLIRRSRELPVTTILVLLRRKAAGPSISGNLILDSPAGGRIEFQYGVVRVWELTTDEVLAAGPGAWPLLPLVGPANRDRLEALVREIEPRVEERIPPAEAGSFWTTMYLLAGLRYRSDVAATLLSGVRQMKDSTTYQAILEEGREEGRADEARRILRAMGVRRWGKPSASVSRKLRSSSVNELERMIERLDLAKSWDDVIAGNDE